MRGFQNNNQGTFFHCSEISERNWVLKLVSSGDVGPAARNVTKNPSQRLDTGIIPTPWWFTPECEQQLLAIGDDGRLPSSSGTTDKEDDVIIAQLNADQLKTKLKSQLEYYFSRENLNQDRYLRSQMDGDQYVPIKIVASFPKISQLTCDLDLIIQVLKESKTVQVDETNTKVRAAHRRTTLLLREIPEFTDEKEVKSMFIGCPPYTSLSYGLNNSWYVTFETEEATQLAFLHLQSLRKSFNGKPICVRIKTGPAPLTDHSDYGRYSPSINGNLPTIVTSKGTIIGIPNNLSMIVTPNTVISNNIGQEINLEKLMGPFGYSIRAIFQPKDVEPPKNVTVTTENLNNLPEIVTNEKNMMNILGSPSTEIVESMLSAAAEANETKKREKENQMLQYQQIMENLALSNSNNSQRITDTPFIMKPPALKRFISQESTELEIALDIQRASRTEKKDESGFQNFVNRKKRGEYNQTNGGGNFNNVYERKNNNLSKKIYENSSRDIRYDKPRVQQKGISNVNYSANNYRNKEEKKYNNNNERRYNKNPNSSSYSSTYSSTNSTTYPSTNSNEYYYDTNNYYYQQQPQLKPIVERKHENYSNNYSKPKSAPTTQTYVQNYQQHIPIIMMPEIIPATPSTTMQETVSTTSSTRKKENSESSEYNFVDNEFPSLVEQVQKEKIKEKAKFSAVVAGKKNEEENKKSYAQTVKKNSVGDSSVAHVSR